MGFRAIHKVILLTKNFSKCTHHIVKFSEAKMGKKVKGEGSEMTHLMDYLFFFATKHGKQFQCVSPCLLWLQVQMEKCIFGSSAGGPYGVISSLACRTPSPTLLAPFTPRTPYADSRPPAPRPPHPTKRPPCQGDPPTLRPTPTT